MARNHKITIRSGSTAPNPSDFVTSEPAWDSTGKKLYVKAADGSMVQINPIITTSTSDPTGGADGDIWIKYTA